MNVGLRIDVDTFRGTHLGVPNLCKLLARYDIRATFFFSVGPDNMGRHLRRLVYPSFFLKMLRSNAPGLYGWDILFMGTLWDGPVIGEKLAPTIRRAASDGHEIGLHAWDHHLWQTRIDKMDRDEIRSELKKGYDMMVGIVGSPPACSAVAGWKCNELTLEEKEKFGFHYNSDCRGASVFRPSIRGKAATALQIPVTLPTYDELVGRGGVCDENYNQYLLSLIRPRNLNVLTIHAEVEGIARQSLFEKFLRLARSKGLGFVPLESLLDGAGKIEDGRIVKKEIPGRQGWVACQDRPEPDH